MDANYTSRTSIAYITEKIRQFDSYDTIQFKMQDNTPILMLTSNINGITYATSLYEYNGYLYELFARTDIMLPLDAGQAIMELENLSFTQTTSNLLKISFTDTNKENYTLYVSIHSDMPDKMEDFYE